MKPTEKWQPITVAKTDIELNLPAQSVDKLMAPLVFSNLSDERSGMYVLIRDGMPVYTGISKFVLERLGSHQKRKEWDYAVFWPFRGGEQELRDIEALTMWHLKTMENRALTMHRLEEHNLVKRNWSLSFQAQSFYTP